MAMTTSNSISVNPKRRFMAPPERTVQQRLDGCVKP
jgi:hypothetical protein